MIGTLKMYSLKCHYAYKTNFINYIFELFLCYWRYFIGKSKILLRAIGATINFFRKITERPNWLENTGSLARCAPLTCRTDNGMPIRIYTRRRVHYSRSVHDYREFPAAKSNTKVIRYLATSLIWHRRWRGASRLLQEFKRRFRRI